MCMNLTTGNFKLSTKYLKYMNYMPVFGQFNYNISKITDI